MKRSINDNMNETGTGLERLDCDYFVDIHCHCLAATDDGPVTMAEALTLCRALVDDGITTAIATPHQLGRFNGCNEAAEIREKVRALNEELRSSHIALNIIGGAEVRVDERICQLLNDDKILTLADGGRYILLELLHEVLIDIEPLLAELASMGIDTVISHPERHSNLMKQHNMLLKWLKYPAHLQVSAGSLLGTDGPDVEKAAWQLLTSGWALLVATDAHDLNRRRPRFKDAFERIRSKLGKTTARLVCTENPLRVLRGLDIVPIDGAGTPLYRDTEVML